VIHHARDLGVAPAEAAAVAAIPIAMIAPALDGLLVSGSSSSLGCRPCQDLTDQPAVLLPSVAGSADPEHDQAPSTSLDAKLLVVHRLLGAMTGNLLRTAISSIVCSKPASIG